MGPKNNQQLSKIAIFWPHASGNTEYLVDMYGSLQDVSIITLAPELDPTYEVIKKCAKMGIAISLGHSGVWPLSSMHANVNKQLMFVFFFKNVNKRWYLFPKKLNKNWLFF